MLNGWVRVLPSPHQPDDDRTLVDLDQAADLGRLVWPGADPVPQEAWKFIGEARRRLDIPEVASDVGWYSTRQALAQLHGIARWTRGGMPTFRPTESLAASLLLSRYAGLHLQDLPLPFGAFAVQLPHPWLPNPLDTLAVLWVHRYTGYAATDGEGRSVIGAWPVPRPETPHVDVLRIDGAVVNGMVLYNAQRMDHSLANDAERWIEDNAHHPDTPPISDEEFAATRLMRRLVIGLCLYVATADLKEDDGAEHRRKLRRRGVYLAAGDKPKVWTLGRDIKIPHALRRAAADFAANRRPGRGRAQWRLQQRFIVRGHFRRVVVGPRAENVRRWAYVQPFWKGPKNGIELRRTYAVAMTPDGDNDGP